MKRKLAWLVGGSFALWLTAALPAYFVAGETALLFSASAWVLCLVPMTVTFLWCSWALRGSPEKQLLAVMGGTAARMAFVVLVGVVLYETVEVFNQPSFLFWVIFFYLTTLFLEVVLVVGKPAKSP